MEKLFGRFILSSICGALVLSFASRVYGDDLSLDDDLSLEEPVKPRKIKKTKKRKRQPNSIEAFETRAADIRRYPHSLKGILGFVSGDVKGTPIVFGLDYLRPADEWVLIGGGHYFSSTAQSVSVSQWGLDGGAGYRLPVIPDLTAVVGARAGYASVKVSTTVLGTTVGGSEGVFTFTPFAEIGYQIQKNSVVGAEMRKPFYLTDVNVSAFYLMGYFRYGF